jgi:hypothetical protein
LEEVVDLVTQSTTKLGLPFFDFFYNFIRILQVAAKTHQRGKNLLVLRPLELLNIHNYALAFNSQNP